MVLACLFWRRQPYGGRGAGHLARPPATGSNEPVSSIRVLLADDNLIVRQGLRALLEMAGDLAVVGTASDYDELISRADELEPEVIVSDIRMPPTFQTEGIDACRVLRKRRPGLGIVILSQYDDPEYAVSLLGGGAVGCAYLLKDRVAEGDQLVRAIRTVNAGGSVLDPKVVEALIRPIDDRDLSAIEEELLQMIAGGRPLESIAVALKTTSADVSQSVENLFSTLTRQAGAGGEHALRNLRRLHQAIVEREEQGQALSRMLPGGIAARMHSGAHRVGESELLTVTILMSDVRGYSRIAEMSDPERLAGQLNEHRAVASRAVLANHGTVMQFVGDAVMAVFGAPDPLPDHADRALLSAHAIHDAQDALNDDWLSRGLPAFELGIGICTGGVAAALLGGEERMEYSVVGDAVNLTQRLQSVAAAGQTVLSESSYQALSYAPAAERLGPLTVKGRLGGITAFQIGARQRDISTSPAPAGSRPVPRTGRASRRSS